VSLNTIDPLSDTRWDDMVARHPRASAFHERGWLTALTRTYGYELFALTSTPPGQPLRDGMVLGVVSSRITGNRFVSLPFSDHCDPLLNDPADFSEFLSSACAETGRHKRYSYVELRPLLPLPEESAGFGEASSYYFHVLDVGRSLPQIFAGFHKDSIQRKILRAEREGLSYEKGRSPRLLEEFYGLQLMTRRRHHLLPQPRSWFRNLVECMGEGAEIRVAGSDGRPIAAILTLRHGPTVVYKYGCSWEKFHHFGGMPFLLWRLIEECNHLGVETIDFGRSDIDNHGLIVFKDRFGTRRELLKYFRHWKAAQGHARIRFDSRFMREILSSLPDAAFSAVGGLLYKHMG